MRLVDLEQMLSVLDEDDALAAVREGFVLHHQGKVQMPPVMHLGFPTVGGDCHVKAAHIAGDPIFVVKVATGFAANPGKGLSPSNGFMAVIDAETGEVVALLHDHGRLTDLRTAMAGAISAALIAKPGATTLGIVGTGLQARLQARIVAYHLGLSQICLWGRRATHAQSCAEEIRAAGLKVNVSADLAELCAHSDVIITATTSTTALLHANFIPSGSRIVAIGADARGKRELSTELILRAEAIFVDSVDQCVDHGDAGWAVREGALPRERLVPIGQALLGPVPVFDPDDIVIADLTGLGIQDAQIARSVWRSLA